MLSGGRVHLGGGHALQQKFGIKDSADQVFKESLDEVFEPMAIAHREWSEKQAKAAMAV